MLDGLIPSRAHRIALEAATREYVGHVNQLQVYCEGRGITEAAALTFRLGYVDQPAPGHERFEGWMSIPYLSPAGVLAMKFRRIDGSSGNKYDGPAGQKIRLFNAETLSRGGDVALVVEGEMDAICGETVLGIPTVGTWGTNWLSHYPRCFGDVDRVLIVADNDKKDDGSNPGRRHAEKIQKTISGAELVLPPLGTDLSEWVAQEGAEGVRKALLR